MKEQAKSTWAEAARLVGSELERLDSGAKEHDRRIRKIETAIAVSQSKIETLKEEIKTKTIAWGSIGALIPIIISIVIGLIFWLLNAGQP